MWAEKRTIMQEACDIIISFYTIQYYSKEISVFI